ncbi:hypothetical protein SAMN02745161_2587 [Halodesulfovibrio marinisediminis DSM 17456]|uniref:Lipoprotein n=1 Tax=Halodesulfovibrio marinisediminis DSM 17456 TaxID=1121457 RepID=A0A1N6IB14_9BACT|nr:hypothetical protein SAMN02745161_2587 [Halodesulfovibrio marinisediminis DSM 17456]
MPKKVMLLIVSIMFVGALAGCKTTVSSGYYYPHRNTIYIDNYEYRHHHRYHKPHRYHRPRHHRYHRPRHHKYHRSRHHKYQRSRHHRYHHRYRR